jgi:3-dehydroquinate dehydratase-2
VSEAARKEGATVEFFQSNHEGRSSNGSRRPGASRRDRHQPRRYTHTSVAIRDALLYSAVPAVELHLSNPSKREEFRKVSLVEDVVAGRICGIGGYGYVLALQAILHLLRRGGRDRAGR